MSKKVETVKARLRISGEGVIEVDMPRERYEELFGESDFDNVDAGEVNIDWHEALNMFEFEITDAELVKERP